MESKLNKYRLIRMMSVMLTFVVLIGAVLPVTPTLATDTTEPESAATESELTEESESAEESDLAEESEPADESEPTTESEPAATESESAATASDPADGMLAEPVVDFLAEEFEWVISPFEGQVAAEVTWAGTELHLKNLVVGRDNNSYWPSVTAYNVGRTIDLTGAPQYLYVDVEVPMDATVRSWNLALNYKNIDQTYFEAVDIYGSQTVRLDLSRLTELIVDGKLHINSISLTAVTEIYRTVKFKQVYIGSSVKPGDTNEYADPVPRQAGEMPLTQPMGEDGYMPNPNYWLTQADGGQVYGKTYAGTAAAFKVKAQQFDNVNVRLDGVNVPGTVQEGRLFFTLDTTQYAYGEHWFTIYEGEALQDSVKIRIDNRTHKIDVRENTALAGTRDIVYTAPDVAGIRLFVDDTELDGIPSVSTPAYFNFAVAGASEGFLNGLFAGDTFDTLIGIETQQSVQLNTFPASGAFEVRVASGSATETFTLGESVFAGGEQNSNNHNDPVFSNLSLVLPSGETVQPTTVNTYYAVASGSAAYTTTVTDYALGVQYKVGDGWGDTYGDTSIPPVRGFVFELTDEQARPASDARTYTLDTLTMPEGEHQFTLYDGAEVQEVVPFVVNNLAVDVESGAEIEGRRSITYTAPDVADIRLFADSVELEGTSGAAEPAYFGFDVAGASSGFLNGLFVGDAFDTLISTEERQTVRLNALLAAGDFEVRVASGSASETFKLGESVFAGGEENSNNHNDPVFSNLYLVLPNGETVQPSTVNTYYATANGATTYTTEVTDYAAGTQYKVGDGYGSTYGDISIPPVRGFVFTLSDEQAHELITTRTYPLDTYALADGAHELTLIRGGAVQEVVPFVVNNARKMEQDKPAYTFTARTADGKGAGVAGVAGVAGADLARTSAGIAGLDAAGIDARLASTGGNISVTSPLDLAVEQSRTPVSVLPVTVSKRTDEGVVPFTEEELLHLATYGETITTATSRAIPENIFSVDVTGTTADKIVVVYEGAVAQGESVRLSAQAMNGEWIALATARDQLQYSAELAVADYAVDGKITVKAEQYLVSNGSDSFVWFSDPQNYAHFQDLSDNYYAITQYTADEYAAGNIGYLLSTGDIVDQNILANWQVADRAFRTLDAADVPYGIVSGNHDVGSHVGGYAGGNYANYWTYFGAERYADRAWFGGELNDNMHHYDLVTIGGVDFIFLYLGMAQEASEQTQAWVREVLAQFPSRNAVIATHQYLSYLSFNDDDTYYIDDFGDKTRVGYDIMEKIVAPNPQIVAVLCGHQLGVVNREVTIAGRKVIEMMANYQGVDISDEQKRTDNYTNENGDGFVKLMRITETGLEYTAYSPVLDKYNAYAAEIDTGSFDVDWFTPARELQTHAFSAYTVGAGADADVYVLRDVRGANTYTPVVNAVSKTIALQPGAGYVLTGDTVSNVLDGMTVAELLAKFTWPQELQVFSSDDVLLTDTDTITTGTKLTLKMGHFLLEQATIMTTENPIEPGEPNEPGDPNEPSDPSYPSYPFYPIYPTDPAGPADPESDSSDSDGVEGGSASPFSDISASHWAYADIAAAQKRCIVTGYTDNTFRPGEPVTREEFVVMLMRAFTVNCAAEQLPDVPTNYTDDAQIGAWARSSIIKADEQNVITGYADGSFRPRSNITRVEATAMLARYLQYPLVDGNTLPFADREEIGIWARAYVEAAVGREVVSGRPNNLFAPLEATTRAEAVSLIMRAIHGSEQK